MAKYPNLTNKSDEELVDLALYLLSILTVRHKMGLLKKRLREFRTEIMPNNKGEKNA